MFRVSYIMGMMNGLPSSMKHSVKHMIKLQSRSFDGVPKGHVAVYVGELGKRRHVVPVAYLNHPLFKVLLKSAEEEFGFNHPMEGLTIPCKEETFISLTYELGIARLQR